MANGHLAVISFIALILKKFEINYFLNTTAGRDSHCPGNRLNYLEPEEPHTAFNVTENITRSSPCHGSPKPSIFGPYSTLQLLFCLILGLRILQLKSGSKQTGKAVKQSPSQEKRLKKKIKEQF